MAREQPIVLYKYKDISDAGIDHVEDLLRGHQIWFSCALEFNDPFDCRCVFDVGNPREELVLRKAAFLAKHNRLSLPDALAAAEAEIPSEPQEVEDWQTQQVKGHSQRAANSGILCLTPICDNFIMWTHYAGHHTGICIQFRVRDVHAEDHIDFIAAAQPVEYADRCPVINIVRDSTPDIVRKAFFTKATAYRYEHEWRIVRFDEGVGLKPIPKGIIGAVILGCQMQDTERDRIIKACAEYDGEVEIVQAMLDPSTYGLNMEFVKTV